MGNLHLFSNARAMKQFFAQNHFDDFLPSAKGIGEFLDFILRVDKKRKIPPFLRNFYLYQAIQENYQETQKLGSFAKNFTQFLLNSSFFLKFYDELCTECVRIESLEKLDIYAFYDDHLNVLKRIFTSYQKKLNANHFFDKYFLEDYKITFELLREFSGIIIHLEGFLSRFEMRIFREISKYLPLTFSFTLDSFNKAYYEKLFGLSLEVGFYEIVLFENEFSSDFKRFPIIQNRQSQIQVLEFKDKIAEVGGIFTQIDAWLGRGVAPEQICIILPDEEFAKYLQLFDKVRNFNYAMGNALKESTLYRNLKEALRNRLKGKNKAKSKESLMTEEESSEIALLEDFSLISIPEFKDFDSFKEFLQTLEINSKESQEIQSRLLESLEEFDFALKYLAPLSVQEKILAFLNMIEEVKLDDIGGGRISVMGILETRGVSLEYVIIPEFNADNVPNFNNKDLFLNTAIREKVGLPTHKNREDLQKHYYAQILQKSKEVWVMCVHNEETKPSLFLLEDSIFQNSTLKASPQYSEYFLNGKTLNYQEREIIAPLVAKSFSATSLQCLLSCKRKYYYRYVLGFQVAQTDKVNLGSKIHQILSEVYQGAKEYAVDSMYSEVCKRLQRSNTAQEFFESALAQKYLKNFFESERLRLREGWIPFVFEKEFSFTFFDFTLKGRMDRIDRRSDEAYVLDYKYKRNLKLESKNYEKAMDFQLPLYALALQKGAIESLNFKEVFAGFYDLYHAKILREYDLEAKIEVLQEKLEAIKADSKEMNFALTPKRETCRYCQFIYLCNRY